MTTVHEASSHLPDGDEQPHAFSQLIRAARLRRHWSQQELANRLGRTKQWINAIEKSDLPSVEQVVNLHDELVRPREPERAPSLGYWLLTWLSQHSARTDSGATERISEALRLALPLFPSALAANAPSKMLSLASFPAAFDRLIVIGGDRREVPAHSGGDLFAYSASVLDLRFLNRLQLGARDVTIWHDKVFVQMSEDYLKQQFGHSHLIVVGSPAVNFLARRINSSSVFRFNISAETRTWDAKAQETFPRPVPFADDKLLAAERSERGIFRLQDRTVVKALDETLRAFDRGEKLDPSPHVDGHQPASFEDHGQAIAVAVKQLLGDRKPSDWIRCLRPLEIADPADGCVHALDDDPARRLNEDLAVVSLAANPFADEEDGYVSILLAGVHGPGTAHAVKALAEEDFAGRPLGGVLKVSLATNRELPERVMEAQREWLTEAYDLDKIQRNLLESPGVLAEEWGGGLGAWQALVEAFRSDP